MSYFLWNLSQEEDGWRGSYTASLHAREYWIIYREPGFHGVVCFGSSPTRSPTRPFSVFLCVARRAYWRNVYCKDKKEIQIFLIYKKIQNGAVAKSYMTNE